MRGFKTYLLWLVLVSFLSLHLEAGQKLCYKFEQGKKYSYATTMQMKITGQEDGVQQETITANSSLDYTVILDSVSSGSYALSITIDKFENKINFPSMKIIDSTIAMTEWVGKRLGVTIDELGNVSAVKEIDPLTNSALGMLLHIAPAEIFKKIFFVLPDVELGIDSTWKNLNPDTVKNMGLTIVMKPDVDFKITAKEVKHNLECWKIVFQGNNLTSGSGSMQGTEVTVDGSTKISGTVYFAPQEGIFVLADQLNDAEMTQTYSGSQSGGQSMRSVVVIHSALKP